MSPEDRYEQLGAALRGLDVPEHEPEFHAQLRARLDAEAPRRHWRRRRNRPARSPARRRVPALRLSAGAIGLAAVLLALLFGGDGSRRSGPLDLGAAPATAAELGARVDRAVAQARTLSGVLFTRQRYATDAPLTSVRTAFLVTAAGDQRLTSTGSEAGSNEDSAYQAATATQMTVTHNGPPNGTQAMITKGLASGPDGGPKDLRRALGGVVPALRAVGDRRIQATRFAGRSAWRLRTTALVNRYAGPGASGDRLEIIVDQATGFPLRVRETLDGRLVEERRVANLRVNVPAPASAFRLTVPRAIKTTRFDSHYRRVPLRRAAAIVGYAPLEPGRLPSGYRRAETSVARTAGTSGNEGANPVSRDVVSTTYRRGFGLVRVTTERRGAGTPACSPGGIGRGPCWSDPLGAGEGFFVTEQPVRLSQGALSGSRARLVIDPRAIPHIWALTDDLVVTISGDLSREELLAAATSLRPAP